MHYSEKLKQEITDEQVKAERAKQLITLFRQHLGSSKFHNDTTIQVSDVNRWLDCVVRELNGDL